MTNNECGDIYVKLKQREREVGVSCFSPRNQFLQLVGTSRYNPQYILYRYNGILLQKTTIKNISLKCDSKHCYRIVPIRARGFVYLQNVKSRQISQNPVTYLSGLWTRTVSRAQSRSKHSTSIEMSAHFKRGRMYRTRLKYFGLYFFILTNSRMLRLYNYQL